MLEELKHVIAQLLEDAKRLQALEPNSGTEARIEAARQALKSGESFQIGDSRPISEPFKKLYSSSNNLGMR
ncbi:hypothetical protein QD840_002060 [Citrobacter koseri]|nr:hypothetical protein [Citrobacter koseri]